MGDSSPPGRIPFEAISDAKSWALPMVDGKVANKDEQRKRKSQAIKRKNEQAQRKAQPEPVESQEVESPEDIPVKPLTARELEEITQAAEQDGFEKGYNEGLEQGKAEGRKSGFSEGLKAGTEQAESEHGQWLKEQGTYLAAICENLLEPAKAQQEALADVVFDLAVGLAKELLTSELRADPAKIVPIIDQAIAALPAAEKNIRLSLHPEDLEAYQRFAPFPSCADCAIADASLERGSCRVKSEHSYVDYSVAARILEFKNALADAPDSEPEPVPIIERPKSEEKIPTNNEISEENSIDAETEFKEKELGSSANNQSSKSKREQAQESDEILSKESALGDAQSESSEIEKANQSNDKEDSLAEPKNKSDEQVSLKASVNTEEPSND